MSALHEIREQVEDDRYSDEFVGIVVRARWLDLLADIQALLDVAEAAQAEHGEFSHREHCSCAVCDALDRLQANQPAETQ